MSQQRITISPDICHGKPVIRGLRYPVQTVLEWLGSGMTIDEILEDYEDLEKDDIYAALPRINDKYRFLNFAEISKAII
jgi:uncharacterized protein (DUF433 family)